jgi:hypothetical protein
MRGLGGLITLVVASCALLIGAQCALAAPAYRDPPSYKGITEAPAVKPPIAPPSVPLSAAGTFPDELVDEAGTAHIVWNDDRGSLDDAAMYCRLPRGAKSCAGGPIALTWNKSYNAGDGPQFNIDNFGPKIVRIGNQLVIFSKRYPTIGQKPDGGSSSTVVAWTSADGGQHWTDAQIVGKWNIQALMQIGSSDPSLLALGQDPFCGGVSGMCVTNYESGSYQPNTGDLALGPNQAYNATLALDNTGKPVAGFTDLQSNVLLRRWTGAGSPGDPTKWTPFAPSFTGGDLKLAGGPAGLFAMSKPPTGSDYQVRRLDGANNAAPAGPPTTVSSGNDPALNDLSEDASGRLTAAWVQRGGDDPGVQLRTSRPVSGAAAFTATVPSLDPAETIIPGANAGQIALASAADGGGFVVANTTGGITSAGPIVASGVGTAAPTHLPGLGSLPGGFGQTNSCGKIKFGAINVQTDENGCFLLGQGSASDKYVTSGAIDLFGLKIVPDAGVKIVFDPKKLTIDAVDASAEVKVIVSSPLTGDITLWHGSFHRDLSKLVPGSELFSFDSSAFAPDILGFDVSKNISVKLNQKGDGIEIPVSLKLPAGFGGASADATFTATQATGLEIGSLHLHLGPVTVGIATLNNFDLVYRGADELWSGEGNITFAGFGAIGAKAEFHMGNFHEAHVSFTPAVAPAIGPFVYLDEADVGFGVDPLFVDLGADIGLGAAVDGKSPIVVRGTAKVTIPDTGPAEFKGTGTLTAALIQVATASVRYQTDGYADFNATINQDLTLLNIKAKMEGFIDAGAGDWGADINGSICLAADVGCLGGDAAAGTHGVAICGTLFGGSAGIRATWPQIQDISESIASTLLIPVFGEVNAARLVVSALAIPCDTKGFKTPPPRAASAQAGGGPIVAVPGGLPTETIAVFGDNSGTPQVDLAGPGGARLAGPASGQQSASGASGRSFAVTKANAVMFVINKPRAGNWTVVPRAGSAKVVGALESDGYRPATAKATVGGKGRSRTLRYRLANLGNGQSIAFIERGRYGTRRIGVASKASGTLKIAATPQPGGLRTVYVQVRRGGPVTHQTAVARYRAVGPPGPGVVTKLKAKRSGRVVTVTWHGSHTAAKYQVKITGKGTSQVRLLGARARSVRFTEIASTVRLTVEVRTLTKRLARGAARRIVSRGASR